MASRSLDRTRMTLAVALAALMLAGCGSSLAAPATAASAGAALQRGSIASIALGVTAGAVRPQNRRSWMTPDAKKKQLLYVSDSRNWDVAVYDYNTGKQVGLLSTDLDYPQGMCVDQHGNIWIANSGAYNLLEFAHGGTTPIATLDDNSYEPVSCSVNPKNGDLAVGNILYFREGLAGNVTVFEGAHGAGTLYSVDAIYAYYFVGYDNQGNLFFDGTDSKPGTNGKFKYAELPLGSSKAKPITLSGGSVSFPGNVQWDGREMTVGDQSNAVIYQTSGGRITGSTPLTGSSDVVQFFIEGKTVVGPDAGNASVEFFHYPAGGSAYETLTGLSEPVGAVISK
jgi:hypothetical protein